MNIKQILLTALALTLPLAGAKATTITTNTAVSPGDTTYDGADLIVSNCTLTVDGVHSFASLWLTDGAVLTHSPAPSGETDNRLDLTITSDLTIDATSRVDANAKGYGQLAGPGAGINSYAYASGGGHGGPGGNGYYQPGGGSYGALLAPTNWGSGGGRMMWCVCPGGAGGGRVRLNVGGVLTVAGQLTANGESVWAGCGAGGSVYLTAGTLAGNGSVTANGGSTGYYESGGGGGGRIAIYYGSSTFSGGLTALGGLSPGAGGLNTGACSGGAGTLYTQVNGQSVGDLRLDNTGRTNAMETLLTAPVAYRLTLTNAAAYATNSLTLSGLRVSAGGLLTHPFQGPRLQVLVQGDAVVEGGGAIGADARGYPLRTGPGAGAGDGWEWAERYGSGAGHGGHGGAARYSAGGLTYGSATEPVDFGSGGGGDNRTALNRGGGAIELTVAGTLTVDGRVSANADAATGSYDGGGAGGSVWLKASRLTGFGSITVNGQSAGYYYSGSGGAGRIAIDTGVNEFAGTVAALGGEGGFRNGGNASPHYGPSVPTGLISWWRGEGDTSDTMGVHPGTPAGSLAYAPGQVGQAFVLNGQNAAVSLGNWFNLQEFTISFWVNPAANQVQWADILDNNHTDYRSWVFQSFNNSSGGASQWSWGAAGMGVSGDSYWLTNNTWQQVVATMSSNHISQLYLNGKSIFTITGTSPIAYDGTQYFNLGKHHLLGRYFNGLVDELMCFNRPLPPEEVASLYFNQGGPLPLSIQTVSGGVLLSWPASAEGFGLVSRPDLTTGNWEAVTNTPLVSGTRKEVLLPANTPAQRFFRLGN